MNTGQAILHEVHSRRTCHLKSVGSWREGRIKKPDNGAVSKCFLFPQVAQPVKKNDIFNKGSKESSKLVKCSKFLGMKLFFNLEPFSQITVLHLKVVPQGLKCNPCIFLERGRFPGSFTNYYLFLSETWSMRGKELLKGCPPQQGRRGKTWRSSKAGKRLSSEHPCGSSQPSLALYEIGGEREPRVLSFGSLLGKVGVGVKPLGEQVVAAAHVAEEPCFQGGRHCSQRGWG